MSECWKMRRGKRRRRLLKYLLNKICDMIHCAHMYLASNILDRINMILLIRIKYLAIYDCEARKLFTINVSEIMSSATYTSIS